MVDESAQKIFENLHPDFQEVAHQEMDVALTPETFELIGRPRTSAEAARISLNE